MQAARTSEEQMAEWVSGNPKPKKRLQNLFTLLLESHILLTFWQFTWFHGKANQKLTLNHTAE